MVGGEVLQERLGFLALRRRKVLRASGFVHLSEQIEKVATELAVELIGRRPLLRRRPLLGEPSRISSRSMPGVYLRTFVAAESMLPRVPLLS